MVTPEQIAALKYVIFKSKKDNDLAKRILALLLDKSEGLTKHVYITLQQDREGYSAEEVNAAAHAVDGMCSCNGNTHLNELLQIAGSALVVSLHYGDYPAGGIKFSTRGQFTSVEGSSDPPLRYTFWLEDDLYGRSRKTRTEIRTDRGELEKIDLKKPGLYPTLE